jgi:hypothetical protein
MPRKFLLAIEEVGNSWAGRPPVTSLHDSREEADAALAAFVDRNWDAEMGDYERPLDPSDVIEEYFDMVAEDWRIYELRNNP